MRVLKHAKTLENLNTSNTMIKTKKQKISLYTYLYNIKNAALYLCVSNIHARYIHLKM